jgi:hypothetical protein
MSTKQNVYSIFYRVEVGLVRAFPRYISIEAEVRRFANKTRATTREDADPLNPVASARNRVNRPTKNFANQSSELRR